MSDTELSEGELQNSLSTNKIDDNEPESKRNRINNKNKIEKEQAKIRKQLERDKLKAELIKFKAEKQLLATAYKNIKPDECKKLITVEIDSDLMSKTYSVDIINALVTLNVSYIIKKQTVPFTITWKMKIQQLININEQLKIDNDGQCEEVLLIIPWDEYVTLVHEDKLYLHIKNQQMLLPNKKLYLGIYGLENYFRFHKSEKQKISSKDKIYTEKPKLSELSINVTLIELQLLFKISHQLLETPQDLSAMLVQFTKSISQIPHKLLKNNEIDQVDWYIYGDNKDCVKIDKNGNGLLKLWKQQLTQFSLVRLEVAEAIAVLYPSPISLFKAYEKCSTTEEKEKLLQDIPIRRTVGHLAGGKKIGPELSRKIFILFTTLDGNIYT